MSQHQWHYIKTGLLGDDQVGPVGEPEFLQDVRAGKIKPDTKVASPTRTGSKWRTLKQIPGLLQTWERGVAERERTKQQQAEERKRQKQAAAHEKAVARQERDVARQQQQEIVDQSRAQTAEISDCSDVAGVAAVKDGISGILTSGEVIEYIAIQQKPVLNVKPDAVVATNRRLIFYRPKLLGRFDFYDYLWRDLGNAHISQGMMGAKFSAEHVSGTVLNMDYLPKIAAQKLYRIAQEREEEAIEIRRQRQMEETRAGASQVSVQTGVPMSQPQTPPAAQAGNSQDDLVKRLEMLKTMLDKQLITQEDFDEQKKQILSQI